MLAVRCCAGDRRRRRKAVPETTLKPARMVVAVIEIVNRPLSLRRWCASSSGSTAVETGTFKRLAQQ